MKLKYVEIEFASGIYFNPVVKAFLHTDRLDSLPLVFEFKLLYNILYYYVHFGTA